MTKNSVYDILYALRRLERGQYVDKLKIVRILRNLTGLMDFTVEFKEHYSTRYWGFYLTRTKTIRLYILDEEGEYVDEEIILREALHELTHHIQWYHTPGWIRKPGIAHDKEFKRIHAELQVLAKKGPYGKRRKEYA